MIKKVDVIIIQLPHAVDLPLPAYGTPESAGADLRAALSESIILRSGQRLLVPTGVAIELPPGYEAQIRPRSGLAFNHGITILNAPGTIDSDYRGELKALLINLGDKPFLIERGMRIAQLVLASCCQCEWRLQREFSSETERATQGFGSTGL